MAQGELQAAQDLREGPVRLEYGEDPPETMVVDDPEFGSNFGKNFTNRNRLFTPLLTCLQ